MRKLAVLLAACLLLAGAAAAATTPTETKWNDKADGFSVILPAKWYAVPRTVAAVNQTIALLKKQKKTDLATAYSFYLTANGKQELKTYVFQAFLFDGPTMDPVPIVISIQVVPGKNPYKPADLPAAGKAYANALASNKGAKITVPALIKLPEGQAEFITGTVPNGGGISTGLELYILTHGKRLYVLSFKINATVLSQAKVFRSIAENFRFL
jgi:hypothetical protein